jgi:adenine deaminase
VAAAEDAGGGAGSGSSPKACRSGAGARHGRWGMLVHMNGNAASIAGQVVDAKSRRVFSGEVHVREGRIAAIEPRSRPAATFLMPGFVDAHVHIESSMLVPSEFARAAVVHGTVATVSDPHEIGNVLGVAGVEYMLDNGAQTPFKFYFGAPSCVPATSYETAGAAITVAEVEALLDDRRIRYLSEMMNFPGVLNGDPDCLAKIAAAIRRGKRVDGHAPGLRGEQAARYFAAGITTDHECISKDEALDKIAAGCKIAIREGSAARNFDALYSLMGEHPQMVMLCSDDKHPDELLTGHINTLVRRAVERGVDVFDALQAACVNPVEHYGLDVGLLRVGDPADFIEVDSLQAFNARRTWIDGRAIEALDGQLITHRLPLRPTIAGGLAVSDPDRDLLKLAVVNRYQQAPLAVAFVRGFGIRSGAMASSVAHDSHNVIAVGVADDELAAAVNAVMEAGGGLAAVNHGSRERYILPLPVAGLMGTGTCEEIGRAYQALDGAVKRWGSQLRAPFMTLSFMALLVIPALKLSDRGLFDGAAFKFTPLFE